MSAQEPLKPAYVIWGEDRATVERALARLVARVAREGGLPPERLRAEETPAGGRRGGVRGALVRPGCGW